MSPQRPQPADPLASPFELRYPSVAGVARFSPGGQPLPQEMISQSQRGRLLAGALEAVTEHGYPATSVAQIIAAARISRKTFYEHFANKEDCVLAAYDLIIDWLGERIAQAVAGIDDWPDAVRVAVRTTVGLLATDLRLATLCAIEILRVGRPGIVRYEASVGLLAVPLRAGRARCPWGTQLPLSLEETVIGGAIWLIGYRLRPEDPSRIAELVPDITYFLLTPYLGIKQAQQVIAGIG